jgi:hypothetical protein
MVPNQQVKNNVFSRQCTRVVSCYVNFWAGMELQCMYSRRHLITIFIAHISTPRSYCLQKRGHNRTDIESIHKHFAIIGRPLARSLKPLYFNSKS